MKKKMKLLAAIAAFAIAFTFATCDNGSDDGTAQTDTITQTDDTTEEQNGADGETSNTDTGGNGTTATDPTTEPSDPANPSDPTNPAQTDNTEEQNGADDEDPDPATPAIGYTVTIASVTHGTVTANKTSAQANETVMLTATSATGYKFVSYTVTDASGNAVTVINGTFAMPESNVTVTAAFELLTYTFTFSTSGGSAVAAQTVSHGSTATKPTAPTKTGYRFDGWFTAADGNTAFNFSTQITVNTTVYAHWTALYIGTKAPNETKAVGDIVFSDGSATPYASGLTLTDEQKNAAIAVIFYVGTECSNDSTSRTLGVGLVHNTSRLAWCTSGAKAYNKNITTIQCPASGSAGALTFAGDKNGSDNLSQIGTFLAANSSTDDTATASNYPAFYFAKNYANQTNSHVTGTDYASGWYLPAMAELFQIWKSKDTVDAASALCGGSSFGNLFNTYWSSSQHDSKDTKALLPFGAGNCGFTEKNETKCVCAVREF